MKLALTRKQLALIVVPAVALCTALATAAIPSASGEIRACYSVSNGRLRVIDEADSCARSETLLTWNQQGPAGPEGPPGSALAYGFVNPDGSLDAEINGGVLGVTHPYDGYYCFDLGGPAHNAVANIDPTTVGYIAVIYTYVPHAGGIGLSGCPDGYNDAAVIIKESNGALRNAGFYANFN